MTSVAPSPDAEVLELRADLLRLALRPDLGGCIAGLWHGDLPILRSTEPTQLQSARKSAAYPLVPYSNRIGFRQFTWQGHAYTTLPNFDDSPHSLHGVGWTGAWHVESSSPREAELRFVHAGDAAWPFSFEARQTFALSPKAATVRMVFTNTAAVAQPVGLGWHPYYVRRERSHLRIEISDRWDSDATELPVRKIAQPDIDSDVADLNYDNCFDGWNGAAVIHDEKFSVQLTSSMHHLVIYTPPDRDYFCVEPVSHVSNAINMDDPAAHGLRTVQPGDSVEVSMALEITAT